MSESVYDFKVTDIKGQPVSLKDYQGKVLLIVNTASKCGFTPQYEGLENLYQKYHDQGLEILGFPCNQFGQQEPGNNDEVAEFCEMNYGVSFPMFAKVDVNGSNADPLYKYLKSQTHGLFSRDIKWNFAKFLIGKDGQIIKRRSSLTKPEALESSIVEALNA